MIHSDHEDQENEKLVASKNVLRQLCKYCISGGIGVVIDFSLFSVLVIFFQIVYYIANIISFCSAIIVVCYLQKNWTFQYKSENHLRLYTKYMISILLIFIVNNILLIYAIEILHLGEIPAKSYQLIISSILGYYIQKKFVFS